MAIGPAAIRENFKVKIGFLVLARAKEGFSETQTRKISICFQKLEVQRNCDNV
jgi:hypothetical protein